jgi:starch synthase
VTVDNLANALRKANVLFQNTSIWRKLQRNGLSTDVSWHKRASQYASLYRDVAANRVAG